MQTLKKTIINQIFADLAMESVNEDTMTIIDNIVEISNEIGAIKQITYENIEIPIIRNLSRKESARINLHVYFYFKGGDKMGGIISGKKNKEKSEILSLDQKSRLPVNIYLQNLNESSE